MNYSVCLSLIQTRNPLELSFVYFSIYYNTTNIKTNYSMPRWLYNLSKKPSTCDKNK